MKVRPNSPTDPVSAYAGDVVAGRVVSCKWVRLACERHLRDLDDDRFKFDIREAVRRIELSKKFRHYKGPAKGKPFEPQPWQEFIIGALFGWKLRDSGLRRFRSALVMVPRKNGKTYKAATVSIQMLIAGGTLQPDGRFSKEAGAEVYFVATKEDQAKIGWNDCAKIIKRSPGFSDIIVKRVKELRFDEQDAVCRPLGSDSDSLDGLNPSCSVKDEFHAWKDRDLHDVIDDAYGAREQPLDFIITTEGTLRGGIHDEVVTHAQNVLQGVYADDSFFAIIYTIDEGDDPFDETSWHKANPNLGVSKTIEYMRDQAIKARLLPSKLSTFLTKQLNVRVNAAHAWIAMEAWDACNAKPDLAGLAGRECVIALDLARSKDMSAAAAIFADGQGGVDVLMRYWLPEDELEPRMHRDRVPYDQWAKSGLLKTTSGNVTDFREIETDLLEWKAQFAVRELAYDPMFATDLALRLRDDHALPITEFVQSFRNFTLPCKELERVIAGKQLRHGGHAILRWNARNVIVREGPSGNMMPDKAKSSARIDGIVALLMALGRSMTQTNSGATPGFAFV